eukprot:TRINITY_DN12333_c5_g1_i1.p1 TRINITY_DN12333_c5_g1~~TRINITY_DN12333_c5_g1_i1.p1  ORF type:complete len:394 (+),score=89.98 TRINITY_DN12333_c5_g1_i1:907-2088(+)
MNWHRSILKPVYLFFCTRNGAMSSAKRGRATIVRVKRRHDEDPLDAFSVYQAKRSKDVDREDLKSQEAKTCVYKRVSSVNSKDLSDRDHIELLRNLRDMNADGISNVDVKSMSGVKVRQQGKARRRKAAATSARQARFKRVEGPRLAGLAEADSHNDEPHLLEIETVGVQADRVEEAMASMNITCNGQATTTRALSPEEQAARAKLAHERRMKSSLATGGKQPIRIPIPVGDRARTSADVSEATSSGDVDGCVFDYYIQISGDTMSPDEDTEFMMDAIDADNALENEDVYEDEDDSNDESNWRNEYPDEDEDPEDDIQLHDGWRDLPDEEMGPRVLGWQAEGNGMSMLQSMRSWRQPDAQFMVDSYGLSDDDDDDEELRGGYDEDEQDEEALY